MKNFIRIVVLSITLAFAANGTATVFAAPTDVVNIPDAGFKACINSYFDGAELTDDVTEAQMELFIGSSRAPIDCSSYSISSIEGAQYFTNIEYLDFYDNSITDLSPLAGLTTLKHLGLNNNNISDLTPLSGLTNLTKVLLRDNDITDVSPLSSLTNLTYLPLSNNNISDVSGLSTLTGLNYLYIEGNNITDLTPLVDIISLTNADLGEQTIVFDESTVDVENYSLPAVYDPNGDVIEYTDANEYILVEGEAMVITNTFNKDVVIGETVINFSGTVSQTVTYSTEIIVDPDPVDPDPVDPVDPDPVTPDPVDPVDDTEKTETKTLPKTGMEQSAALYSILVLGLIAVKKKFL